jgi:hypothetical protein
MFGKNKDKHPIVVHLMGVRDEVGGDAYLISDKEFDKIFAGCIVLSMGGTQWSYMNIGPTFIKIYRRNERDTVVKDNTTHIEVPEEK